ncbi:MAG TPA: mandelate racemase/muconate lactonizing enzyme family protein [Casimicrobiaceae bacterium]|nr:mandelate racemase/muconate lactonizing enzyme family protein [Casimicrobiaceae bacterium]
MDLINVKSVEAFAYRVPIATPVKVSFGTFRDRPMVLVRVATDDGAEGWGEVWCNWPAVGAEHRARLAADIGERLIGRKFESPEQGFEQLSAELEVLALQTGEPGPIASAIAGIDIALWDLTARRQRLPLYRALGAPVRDSLPVYATGINPDQPERFAADRYAEGHRAFKLKTGFDHARDLRNLRAMREALGPDAVLTCDANQALGVEAAMAFARDAAPIDIQWFEEAIRVDTPIERWRRLADASPIPLAGGENLQGREFQDAIADRVLRVIQPDVTKWGGVSGNSRVARATVGAGKRYCPHYFGGGVSLLASLHVLAAAGGTGLLEFDCHPNAGRELVVGSLLPVADGRVPVPKGDGLGATPDALALDRYRTWPPRH